MINFVGKQIDRYRITERLGMGGMAVVYKAYDTRLERDVALKLIRTEAIPQDQHERLLKRFEREAKSQARFSHPNIVPVYDYGEVNGSPYIVMDYISGQSLKQRLSGPTLYRQAIQWLIPISDALYYAHRRGVIHRDVKPSNILFDDEGRPLLTDFGIAKILETDEATLTGTGLGVGTPEYMAPEQWQGQANQATDQYALGVVLYELLTGEKPYKADTPAAVAIMQATEPLRAPSQLVGGLPEGLEKVLYKALAREPQDRYEDMADFQGALGAVLDADEKPEPVPLEKPAPQPPPKPATASPLDSEGATRDALEAGTAAEARPATAGGEKAKAGLPKWVLWAVLGVGVIGIGAITMFGILIGFLRDSPDQSENGEAVGVLQAAETVQATEEPSPLETETFTPTKTSTIAPTPTEALGVGSTKVNEVDGAEMVYVPAGEFLMGSEVGNSDESPEHTVYLYDYWIYKYEVTNDQYRLCVEENNCIKPRDTLSFEASGYGNHPVVYVNWRQAKEYCTWAGGRLPTEAEWEKAARGTDGGTYPWGEERPTCNLAHIPGCGGGTAPVGSFPEGASPYGALDMAGNVWEWVADWYDADYYGRSPDANPTGPGSGDTRVLRGGSWNFYVSFLRSSFRYWYYPDYTNDFNGFRCLRSE
jgi:eukaryotic-like serine/threonine-protein kinase